ncbi:MAG: UpxY family transcription antiterminator [Bacteroidia bacterium]
MNQTPSEKLLWYVLYTSPRAEKKVQIELEKKGFKTFLPLQRTLKQWSDRKKWVEEPLFKSYIFIETELEKNYYDILNTPGIVKFINFERKPVVVNVKEIETIRLLMGYTEGIEATEEAFEIGQIVEVIAGPLLGLNGLLVQKNGKSHFMVELEAIHQKILIHIPTNFLRIASSK